MRTHQKTKLAKIKLNKMYLKGFNYGLSDLIPHWSNNSIKKIIQKKFQFFLFVLPELDQISPVDLFLFEMKKSNT